MQLDCSSLEALFTGLASDDAFRLRLLEHPHETFAEYGIEVSEEVTSEDLKLPPKSHFEQLLALMQRPGFDAAGFVAVQAQAGIFTAPQEAQAGIFTAPQEQAGIFTAPQEAQSVLFAARQQTGIFTAPQEQAGIFTAPQQDGIFTAPQQAQSVLFAARQQTGIFTAPQEQAGIFTAPQQEVA